MKLKPYKEILKMAKEAIDETLAPVRAKKAKKQAELKMPNWMKRSLRKNQRYLRCARRKMLTSIKS